MIDELSIIEKYEGYTEMGIRLIADYFGRSPGRAAYFEPSAQPDHDKSWRDAYEAGQRCRFVVGVEEFEGRQSLKMYGNKMRWTLPDVEFRVVVRDMFQGDLVFSQRVAVYGADHVATVIADRYGFILEKELA